MKIESFDIPQCCSERDFLQLPTLVLIRPALYTNVFNLNNVYVCYLGTYAIAGVPKLF